MVGHNPGIEELVRMLTGEEHIMSTSLAHVQLATKGWNEIFRGKLLADLSEHVKSIPL